MDVSFATYILFSLLGTGVSLVSGVSSNIHEKMTRSEIFDTFGTTEDSLPDYRVFSVRSSELRRKREAEDEIKLKLKLDEKEYNLNLKPSKGSLISKYTPVWLASTDTNAYKNIRYDPQPTALTDIGEFKLYYDLTNEAAIAVYEDPSEGEIIQGVVTSDFAIKSLPKRLMNEVLELGEYVVRTPLVKRSVNDIDQDMHYYVAYKIPEPPTHVKRSLAIDNREKRQGQSRSKKAVPEAVYPEIMLVLDHNAIRNQTMTQALRFMVAYWNGVDMVYSALSNPKVYLNIAGIIVSADDQATPYIDSDVSKLRLANAVNRILSDMGKYFYSEEDRFPFHSYDMIIAMTTCWLCFGEIEDCQLALGVAKLKGACTPDRYKKQWKAVLGTGVFMYNWDFSGIDTAVHEAAHLFGVEHDEGQRIGNKRCDMEEGYAMAAAATYHHQSFQWSACSLAYFRRFFSRKESECLNNKPLWMEPVEEILPGRWLSLDGQCKNSGLVKGCKAPKIPICMAKGCKAEGSDECVINEYITLPGTKCGENKFCNSKSTCVAE